MSGHSKWSTIKRKKEKTDQARAKVFTRIGRELAMVVRAGGPDPNVNAKLRDVISKAKANNVPNDNIERIIKKAAGEQGGAEYESLMYEGYGPSGVAVIVETLTDNRNRTAGEMRHYFDKCGGNLGQSGSVTFMFEHKGLIVIDGEGLDEDKVMEDALEAGAEDFTFDGEIFEISTDVNSVGAVSDALSEKGYKFLSAEPAYVPSTLTAIEDEELVAKMEKLISMLDENDDVQNVWHNWDAPADES
jgi:YebC/PmpR family DNA-binding regulatory protein